MKSGKKGPAGEKPKGKLYRFRHMTEPLLLSGNYYGEEIIRSTIAKDGSAYDSTRGVILDSPNRERTLRWLTIVLIWWAPPKLSHFATLKEARQWAIARLREEERESAL